MGFLCFKKKQQKPVSLQKNTSKRIKKNRWVVFKKNEFFSTLIIFHFFFVIFP